MLTTSTVAMAMARKMGRFSWLCSTMVFFLLSFVISCVCPAIWAMALFLCHCTFFLSFPCLISSSLSSNAVCCRINEADRRSNLYSTPRPGPLLGRVGIYLFHLRLHLGATWVCVCGHERARAKRECKQTIASCARSHTYRIPSHSAPPLRPQSLATVAAGGNSNKKRVLAGSIAPSPPPNTQMDAHPLSAFVSDMLGHNAGSTVASLSPSPELPVTWRPPDHHPECQSHSRPRPARPRPAGRRLRLQCGIRGRKRLSDVRPNGSCSTRIPNGSTLLKDSQPSLPPGKLLYLP